MKITTTLNEIRKHYPCPDGWAKLLKHLGKTKADDEPLPLTTILESNGPQDCLWALRTRPDLDSLWRHLAVDFACYVKHLMTDERSKNVLLVARRYADGEATDEELRAAHHAARSAASAADAAAHAATTTASYAAALAAKAAYAALAATTSATAVVNASAAARSAVYAAYAAARSAVYAADAAAKVAAHLAFIAHLRSVLEVGERVTPTWMETTTTKTPTGE